MTTLAELRVLVRAELGDTTVTPLWPDERLDTWIRETIRAYGRALPRAVTVDLASIADEPVYALPSDTLAVLGVEHPLGTVRALADGASGVLTYAVFGQELRLDPAPAAADELIRVRTSALYPVPLADADVCATPPAGDGTLVLGVAARALRWLANSEAKALRYGPTDRAGTAALARASAYEQAFANATKRRSVRVGRLTALGP